MRTRALSQNPCPPWAEIDRLAHCITMITPPARTRRLAARLAVAASISAVAGAAHAADRSLSATRAQGPIAIDGALDEASWREAGVGTGFWQRAPNEGGPPAHETEFRVLYDHDTLYVGVRAHDDQPALIRDILSRRDQESPADWIEIGIDAYNDKRTARVFAVNPAGVQRDYLVFNDNQIDVGWDAVWSASARIDAQGWSAELAIPLNQLRFAPAAEQVWGIQVIRTVGRSKEKTSWTPWPTSSDQLVSRFGQLDGITGVNPPRRIELRPYAVGSLSYAGDTELDGDIGADFDVGLSNNVTLTGTVNPDFGQVEADPSQVNLTADEIFFAEKRPFFLEGTDIFQFGLSSNDLGTEGLFYSRRIGSAGATIYGAAKLSGKTGSGWSFGSLAALTSADGLTGYTVSRLKKDLNRGRTNLGVALTSVNRRFDDQATADLLHEQAYGLGLQLSHRFARDRWLANARLLGSYVHGSRAAIASTQRSSQRYLHRPDADHLDYDPTRTGLTGAGLIASIAKVAGTWQYTLGVDARSPELELNDIGFQQTADYVKPSAFVQYRLTNPSPAFNEVYMRVNAHAIGDFSATPSEIMGDVEWGATLSNYWNGFVALNWFERPWDPRLLRGGPALRADDWVGGGVGVVSDARAPLRFELTSLLRLVPANDSWWLTLYPAMTWQISSNFDIGITPIYSQRRWDEQYVTTVTDTEGVPQYLLAEIDQTTLAFTVRVNYTFTPALTLQLYAQPFASAGAYRDYKTVANARARSRAARFDLVGDGEGVETDACEGGGGDCYYVDRDGDGVSDYSFARADFNFRELRSNLVLRWEYLPGAALFAVWSHGRAGFAGDGDFALGREARGLVDAAGEHVFLLKLSYWHGL